MELIPPNTKIDFLGNRHYAYAFSLAVIVLALLSYPVKGFLKLGIDFTGGVSIQVLFKKPVDTSAVREALKPFGGEPVVQRLAHSGSGDEYIVRMEAPKEESEDFSKMIRAEFDKSFGNGAAEIRGIELVGPKVGHDLRTSAIWATVVALGMLLVYMGFRFTFSMGLGAVLCLVHDLIAIYGFFVWTGREFNLTILAAALTIVGYDVNDTIVVCDRIRDNLKLMKKSPLIEIMNVSINQTLSRTVLTSGFTALVVVALIIFGTPLLKDFGWALLVGIIFGTYSTIFVASPLVLALDRFFPVKRG